MRAALTGALACLLAQLGATAVVFSTTTSPQTATQPAQVPASAVQMPRPTLGPSILPIAARSLYPDRPSADTLQSHEYGPHGDSFEEDNAVQIGEDEEASADYEQEHWLFAPKSSRTHYSTEATPTARASEDAHVADFEDLYEEAGSSNFHR